MEVQKNPKKGLSYFQQFPCGVGQVINDVTRRMVHSFRMIFLMRVVGISATYAGLIAFCSLFAGAFIFAPLAGFLCDKVKIPVLSRKHGKKKSWYLFGTIATAIGLPLFFSKCLVCGRGTRGWVVLLYYFLIATVLSFSMNFVNISHLSIIPVLVKDQIEATKLTALRTGFMYLTGIVSYLVAWLILGQDSRNQLTKESSVDFMIITLILTGVGLVCSGIFYFGTKEPSEDSNDNALSESTADSVTKSSFIPSPVVLESLAHFGIYQQRKKDIRDRVIDSLRLSEEQTCSIREESFSRTFFEAIFAGSETKKVSKAKTVEKEEHDPTPNVPVVSREVKSEDDLTFVKALPKERKISLMMSIFDEMMTKEEDSIEENDAKPNNVRPIYDIREEDGQEIMENRQQKSELYNQSQKLTSGVDNEGFDTNETQLNQHFPDVSHDEGKALPSVASDVESAHSLKPKTVRSWLKDPHLYKVAIVYTCTKSSQDVFYAYLPLVLTDKLKFEKASSGLVFSVVGTFSHLTLGTLYLVIQVLFPKGSESSDCQECGSYVQNVFSFVPSSLAAFSLLLVIIFQVHQTVCGKKGTEKETEPDSGYTTHP